MKNYNKLFISVIIITIFTLLITSLNSDTFNLNFFKVNRKSDIILSGLSSTENPKITKELSSFSLFGPFNNKVMVSFDELNQLEKKESFRNVFITNKLNGLIPNTEYEATVTTSLKVDEFKDKNVKLGLINYEPEMTYNANTKNILSNISTNASNEFNSFKVIEGLNKINTIENFLHTKTFFLILYKETMFTDNATIKSWN